MGFLSRLLSKPGAPKLKIVVHEAFDGAIRVFETPIDDGWEILEDSREGDGFSVMVLKYILPGPPMPLVLLAKIYVLDSEPEPPEATRWDEALGALFASQPNVQVTSVEQLTMKSKLPAREALVSGSAKDFDGELLIRERRSVREHEQFVVTAMGESTVFHAHKSDIDKWFENTAFVPVGDAD